MSPRFLIDAQLLPALAEAFQQAGFEAVHVADIGLLSATDHQIWQAAIDQSAALVTKDRDFLMIRAASDSGPTVVWIRSGNVDNRDLIEQVIGALPAILAAIERQEAVMEVTARR
jgi:predicted nuclease of predicted toxin-antitoxin system